MAPEKETIKKAKEAKEEGKAPTTQASEFVHEEIRHVRRGKHGARSTKQAIAIGLSKARRAGVKLKPPEKREASDTARKQAKRDLKRSKSHKKPSVKRSRAVMKALKREGRIAASRKALSRQAKSAARRRSPAERSAAARKAAQTKGPAVRKAAARKAARTRAATRR